MNFDTADSWLGGIVHWLKTPGIPCDQEEFMRDWMCAMIEGMREIWPKRMYRSA